MSPGKITKMTVAVARNRVDDPSWGVDLLVSVELYRNVPMRMKHYAFVALELTSMCGLEVEDYFDQVDFLFPQYKKRSVTMLERRLNSLKKDFINVKIESMEF